MKIKKKTIVITAAGIGVLGIGAWYLSQNLRASQVDVYPVSDLTQSIWQSGTSLEGMIASQVSQEVHLLDKQIVSAVHVQEGQEVKKGDPLLSYDMTLVNIDLETEKLSLQQLEIKKKALEQELENLKKDKAKGVSHKESYQVEFLGELWEERKEMELAAEGQGSQEEITELPFEPSGTENSSGLEEEENNPGQGEGAKPGDTQEPEPPSQSGDGSGQEPTTDSEKNPEDEEPSDSEEGQEPEIPSEPEPPKPSGVYSRLYGNILLEQNGFTEEAGFLENAAPYTGTGTQEDPYHFLCEKNVLIQGAFLNWAGGFDGTGARSGSPVYCLLEVKSENKEDGVLLAVMLLDGNKIQGPAAPQMWFRTYLGNDQWEVVPPVEDEVPEDEELEDIPGDFVDFIPQDDIIQGYSKEELEKAVKEKEKEITEMTLDIKEADLKIKKVEQQLKDEVVKSTLDGTVKKVGDPEKGEIDGEPFIVVESAAGAYIQGMAGEYQLKSIEPGQMLTGIAYESQMGFQAEITEVSPYPQEGYYGGMQEQSYYPFTAVIQEGEGFKANEMVSMDLPAEGGEITGIFVSREYIRSQNGEEFVYKAGEDQRLKKQKITTGRTFYGSAVEIKEGITPEDKLAFPYGKNVREGAKIREASIEELYSMY